MKLTKSRLKQLIKEELQTLLNDGQGQSFASEEVRREAINKVRQDIMNTQWDTLNRDDQKKMTDKYVIDFIEKADFDEELARRSVEISKDLWRQQRYQWKAPRS